MIMTRVSWLTVLLGMLVFLQAMSVTAADLTPVDFSQGWPVRPVADEPPLEATLATRVIWTLDCGEDSEPLVGRLQHATMGQEGRLFLADSQMGHILQISPAGQVEALRGRRGEGPGEFNGLHRVVQLPDGRLGAVGGASAPAFIIGTRGELVFIDRNDEPAGTWMIGGDPGTVPTTAVRDVRPAGERLLAVTDRTVVSPPRMTNVRELSLLAAPDGARTVLVRQLWDSEFRDFSWHEADHFDALAYGRCDLSLDGQIAFAPERDRWLVAVGEPGGAGEIWQRSLSGVKRSAAEREAAREDLGAPFEMSQTSEHHPLIRRVRWRPDGRLWVEPWGVEPRAGCVACFDEFSTDGHLLRRVHVAADAQVEHGRPQLLGDGRMVWFEGFEWRDEAFEGAPRVCLLEVVES